MALPDVERPMFSVLMVCSFAELVAVLNQFGELFWSLSAPVLVRPEALSAAQVSAQRFGRAHRLDRRRRP